MDYSKLVQIVKEIGFTDAALISPSDLIPLAEVRNMCAVDRCGAYGKKWTCPPHCGTLEECTERIRSRTQGVVMLSVTKLEDSFDLEGMQEAGKVHQKLFAKAADTLRKEFPDLLPLGAGGCSICETCTCPDEPCRFPDRLFVPMEAYGLLVSDVCNRCGLKYYNGEVTVTYVSCIVV